MHIKGGERRQSLLSDGRLCLHSCRGTPASILRFFIFSWWLKWSVSLSQATVWSSHTAVTKVITGGEWWSSEAGTAKSAKEGGMWAPTPGINLRRCWCWTGKRVTCALCQSCCRWRWCEMKMTPFPFPDVATMKEPALRSPAETTYLPPTSTTPSLHFKGGLPFPLFAATSCAERNRWSCWMLTFPLLMMKKVSPLAPCLMMYSPSS